MRISALITILVATGVLAESTLPSVELSDAVFTGKVLSVEMVRVEGDQDYKWELWRGQVQINAVAKQDTNLTDRVSIYFEQNHTATDGTHYMVACPGRPVIVTNQVYRFFCVREDVGKDKHLLFIPEGGWVVRE